MKNSTGKIACGIMLIILGLLTTFITIGLATGNDRTADGYLPLAIVFIIGGICGIPLIFNGYKERKSEEDKETQKVIREAEFRGISLEQWRIEKQRKQEQEAAEARQHFQEMARESEQRRIEEERNPLTTCKACRQQISKKATACPHCGEPMAKRCPKCGSTEMERITGFQKGLNAELFGAFSANTLMNDYRCKKCGEKFR